jgi:hypothetical protein
MPEDQNTGVTQIVSVVNRLKTCPISLVKTYTEAENSPNAESNRVAQRIR